jgi:Tol biopolymer transport system component
VNTLVAIDRSTKTVHTVANGQDFYSDGRFSHDGSKICWKQWNHPDMLWTGNQLYVADWDNGKVSNVTYIAGKADKESVSQPRWSLDGTLFFASDRTGYYQLYHLGPGSKEAKHIKLEGLDDVGPEWWLGR